MPSSPLRRALRAAGHHRSPVVQVGKEGVTPAVVEQLVEALAAHELVKVKVGTESPEDRFEAAERLGREAGAQIAQILGRTVLAYRRHPEKPRFEPLPPAERRERPEPEPRRTASRKPARRRPVRRARS
jgi:RNA-binding protein